MATGIDRIMEKIAEEAQRRCQEIDLAAKKEAEALWKNRMAAACADVEGIMSEANIKVASISAAGTSGAESISKKKLLETKNAVMNDVISAAYEKLTLLPAREYFDVLVSLCAKHSLPQEGVLHLNKADLRRAPKDFEQKLSSALAETNRVTVSNIAYDISNGFVLVYGDIEINCTFKALFDEAQEELKDIIRPILFG